MLKGVKHKNKIKNNNSKFLLHQYQNPNFSQIRNKNLSLLQRVGYNPERENIQGNLLPGKGYYEIKKSDELLEKAIINQQDEINFYRHLWWQNIVKQYRRIII